MSIAPVVGTAHPVVRAVGAIDAALDEVAAVDPGWMDPSDKALVLVALQRQLARLRALQLRVLATADDVAAQAGARSAGVWLDTQVRVGHAEARRGQRLAEALVLTCPQVATAMGEGVVSEAQAGAIVSAIEELPEDVGPGLRERAEAHLIGLAADFDPVELRRLGRHVLAVVAPEVSEAGEYQALLAAERAGRAATRLTLRSCPDGTAQLSARIPETTAARLRVYLDALGSPRREHGRAEGVPGGEGTTSSVPMGPRRRGEAFCALLERVTEQALPEHGAVATTVMVLIDHDQLTTQLTDQLTGRLSGRLSGQLSDGLGAGRLATGEPVSAGEVRRLACQARILPVVLGGDSEVLDLGRSRRLFSAAQRKAMVIRDQRCRATGCTIPAAWCEAHHWRKPWSRGGKTDLADGVLLCSWHHHRAHDPDYDHRRLPDGSFRFTRRT